MLRALRSYKLYVPLITIVGSAGLFFLMYFLHVTRQRSYANERAFRQLSAVGDQLARKFESLRNIFRGSLMSTCPPLGGREGELTLTARLVDNPGSFVVSGTFRPAQSETRVPCSVSTDVDLNAELSGHFHDLTEEDFDDFLIATSS